MRQVGSSSLRTHSSKQRQFSVVSVAAVEFSQMQAQMTTLSALASWILPRELLYGWRMRYVYVPMSQSRLITAEAGTLLPPLLLNHGVNGLRYPYIIFNAYKIHRYVHHTYSNTQESYHMNSQDIIVKQNDMRTAGVVPESNM